MTPKSMDSMYPMEEDRLPLPSNDSSRTAEMVDLTQPMEGDDCFSLSGNSDDTVDWSQAVGGDLGDTPVLDPHLQKFLSRAGLPDGKEDGPGWLEMPKPPLDDP